MPYKFGGLNLIGLKRHQFSREVRLALSRAFKLTYRSGIHLDEAISRIEKEIEPIPEIRHWIDFCRSSKRGLLGLQGVAKAAATESENEEDLLEE